MDQTGLLPLMMIKQGRSKTEELSFSYIPKMIIAVKADTHTNLPFGSVGYKSINKVKNFN